MGGHSVSLLYFYVVSRELAFSANPQLNVSDLGEISPNVFFSFSRSLAWHFSFALYVLIIPESQPVVNAPQLLVFPRACQHTRSHPPPLFQKESIEPKGQTAGIEKSVWIRTCITCTTWYKYRTIDIIDIYYRYYSTIYSSDHELPTRSKNKHQVIILDKSL